MTDDIDMVRVNALSHEIIDLLNKRFERGFDALETLAAVMIALKSVVESGPPELRPSELIILVQDIEETLASMGIKGPA